MVFSRSLEKFDTLDYHPSGNQTHNMQNALLCAVLLQLTTAAVAVPFADAV